MNEPISPYVLTNENSPAFWLIDNLWMPLAGSFLTGGNFCFLEQICGTGIGGPPTHAHPSDEGLYLIEGHCTFNAGGKTVEAGPRTAFGGAHLHSRRSELTDPEFLHSSRL